MHRDDARPLVTRMFLSGQLVAKARAKLDGQRPQLGLLFAAIDYEAEVIPAAVLVAFPGLELIGCTTDGELPSEHGFSEDSAVLCLLAGDDVRIASGVARQVSAGPEVAIRESVEEAARRLGDAPRLCLTTPTSMTVSDSAIVRALRSALGSGTPVFCATAADQWRVASALGPSTIRISTQPARVSARQPSDRAPLTMVNREQRNRFEGEPKRLVISHRDGWREPRTRP